MASKRMFNLSIYTSDRFLALTSGARVLYTYANLFADDYGVFDNLKTVLFLAGASLEDLQALIQAEYLFEFPGGLFIIRHWHIHNQIDQKIVTESLHSEVVDQLDVLPQGEYIVIDKSLGGNGNQPAGAYLQESGCDSSKISTQERLNKSRGEKISVGKGDEPPQNDGSKTPTIEEIATFAKQEKLLDDAARFYHYYEAVNWHVGNKRVFNWRSLYHKWVLNDKYFNRKRNNFQEYDNSEELPSEPVGIDLLREAREFAASERQQHQDNGNSDSS